MINLSMKGREEASTRLRWAGYVVLRRLGMPGLIAALALVVLAGTDALLLQPRTIHLEGERDAREKTLQFFPELRMQKGKPGLTLREVQRLQSGVQAYSIFQVLKNHDLDRRQATYSRQVEAKGKLRRLAIDITLTGSYTNLRSAIREIADQPMVRIERVSIERESMGSQVVNADMRITLLGPDS